MTRKRHYTDVRFGYQDGNIRTVRLLIGEWHDGDFTLEGHDLDMVTAAFFHLRGHDVQPGLKRFGLRKYKNCATTTITDDRMSYRRRHKRHDHALAFSLSVVDDRPDDLRLFVTSTHTRMYMNFMMNKATTEEFGRRLAAAAEWEVAA